MKYIKQKIEIVCRKLLQIHSKKQLSQNILLWKSLQDYIQKTNSTGCGYIDYYRLYQQIKKGRFKEVLECGTGVTTLIIAHALMENEKETGVSGRVTSMEEFGQWLEMSEKLLPKQYCKYVNFVLSATEEDRFSFFRDVRYSSIPERAYDFVFVDGPKYHSPIDNCPTFDFDFIHILTKSRTPVAGMIGKRVSTVFVLQQLLGLKKVRYSNVEGLGYISRCTSQDLGQISRELSSNNFKESFQNFGNSKLRITSTT